MSFFGKATDLVVCFPIFKIFDNNQDEIRKIVLALGKRAWVKDKLSGYGGKVDWDVRNLLKRCMRRTRQLKINLSEGEPDKKVGKKTSYLLYDIVKLKKAVSKSSMLILNQIVELLEKSGVEAFFNNIIKLGEIEIWNSEGEMITLHIYTINACRGSFVETDEMGLPSSFDADKPLPYEEMIEGDDLWLPEIVRGKYVHAIMVRDADDHVVHFEFV